MSMVEWCIIGFSTLTLNVQFRVQPLVAQLAKMALISRRYKSIEMSNSTQSMQTYRK